MSTSRSRLAWSYCSMLAIVASGCAAGSTQHPSSDAGARDSGGGRQPDGGSTPAKLSFSPCPLLTEPGTSPPSGPIDAKNFDGAASPTGELLAASGSLPDLASAQAECATTRLPAKWSDPHGDSIDVFVKRYPARKQPVKGQLWLLAGGPGLPGSIYDAFAFLIAGDIPSFDIYLPDHRGTGRSTPAPCDSLLAIQGCAANTPHLDGLTMTDAARDLAWLIDASHAGSQHVVVYGASYGTAWAQRYLQLRPDQPSAVILDSTVAVGADTADSDKHLDAQARTVLARCAADATCAAKLGSDPIARAEEAIAAVRAGTCRLPAGMPAALSQYFGTVVSTSSFELPLLPASIYRVLRCNPQDLDWLAKVWAYLGWRGALPAGNSDVVWVNITLSEFWWTDATADALASAEESMLAMTNVWWFARQAETWPKYPHDEFAAQWPTSNVPMLVMQGGLDPITPYGDVVAMHYSGNHQYFVQLPESGHHLTAPTASALADFAARGCGWQIMKSFLEDTGKAPDTSCIGSVAPVTFSAPSPEWLGVVGIADLWENP